MKKARKRNENVEKSILLYGLALANRLFLFVLIRFSVFPHFLLTSNGFLGFAIVLRLFFSFHVTFTMPKTWKYQESCRFCNNLQIFIFEKPRKLHKNAGFASHRRRKTKKTTIKHTIWVPQTSKNQENDNKIYYLGATDFKKPRKRQ